MPRSLQEIDVALATIEIAVPAVKNGLNQTLGETTLALDSQLTTVLQSVGVQSDPTNGNLPTGMYASIANLLALVQDLQARVTLLEAVP